MRTTDISESAGDMPDASGDFRSELAALLSYYASRIAAARIGGLPATIVASAVKALLGEQTVALRSLIDRWQAATRNRNFKKPERPIGHEQSGDRLQPS